ncbi:electron transport complex subunit RsxD [Endozoicomonas gorgoniicola]|uniref:Ion-translocating oxidoreductase complex subunit D n=1 Tax=Endozoicomonas gorgoniicola TaxID=1234144 RepID=A0ABT3MPK9_9GAMM|nr:electron transport complex subunit RsxD [Endozoicomonas gorgoniicola]MCW7551304.1 electron transport complex subunit RsxD [Endozoicomonas gorgoniicola]
MTLVRQTSPHARGPNSTQQVMKLLLIAAIPGILAQTWFFGWGALINLVWCSLIALGAEALILKIRNRPPGFFLSDGSAIVTAVLMALALPPFAPWWLTLTGVSFAIIIGKQLYGGLGNNPFNPAMLGYVLLLISFPQEMTQWLAPNGLEGYVGSFADAFNTIFPIFGQGVQLDAISMATPLDIVRENSTLTMAELREANDALGTIAGRGWLWVNLAYLLGGLFMLYKKVFTWHAPVGMLVAMTVMATLFWGGIGSGSNGSPLFHLFSGATMLGAFFIITDPVSSATSTKGRLIFGALIGVLTYVIRTWGGYPDGVAFATLLLNMAAPTIDYYTQPRTYGHKKANKGLPKTD